MKNDDLIKFQLKIDNGQMAHSLLINKEFELLEHWLNLGGKINNVNAFLEAMPNDYILPQAFFNFINPKKLDSLIDYLPFENCKTNTKIILQLVDYAKKENLYNVNFELDLLDNLLKKGSWEYLSELSKDFSFSHECLTQFLFKKNKNPKVVAKTLLTFCYDFAQCNYNNYPEELLVENSSLWLYDLIKEAKRGGEEENSYDPDYGRTYSFRLYYENSDYYLALATELLNHVKAQDLKNTHRNLFEEATFDHFLYEISEDKLRNYQHFLLTLLNKVEIEKFPKESVDNLIEQTLSQSKYFRTHHTFWSNFVTPLFNSLNKQTNFNYFPEGYPNYEFQFKDRPSQVEQIQKLKEHANNYGIRQEKTLLEKEIKNNTSHHKIKI